MKAEEPKREASEACCGETWGVAQARWKPAEESVWLAEQRAAVVTKPRALRPCLVKNKNKNRRSWGRQIDRRIRKPQHGSRCLDGNVESVMQW